MIWGALSFNNDNTDIYFDLTFPLSIQSCIFSYQLDFRPEKLFIDFAHFRFISSKNK